MCWGITVSGSRKGALGKANDRGVNHVDVGGYSLLQQYGDGIKVGSIV